MRKLRSPIAVSMGLVVLAALVALTWWLFLGSDTTYQHDANGRASGPYEAPQVLVCIVVLALLSIAGAAFLPLWAAIITIAASFTVPWSVDASDDRSGLWVVGAMGVLLGTLALSSVVGYVTEYQTKRTLRQVR